MVQSFLTDVEWALVQVYIYDLSMENCVDEEKLQSKIPKSGRNGH